jgi:hypothetical protein
VSSATRRLRAALAALLVKAEAPELALVHRWLDNWQGVGLIVAGIQRAGFDVELRQYPQGWRVNVRRTGGDAVVGSGWESMPWTAMQRAAWAAVRRVGTLRIGNLQARWLREWVRQVDRDFGSPRH